MHLVLASMKDCITKDITIKYWSEMKIESILTAKN